MNTLGERLNQIRKLRRLSQSELAEKIGVTFQQIQKYEKNINNINSDKLKKLAEVLNVPVGYFFGEYEIINGKLQPSDDLFFGEPYYIDDSIQAKLERLEELIEKHNEEFLNDILDYAEYKHSQMEKKNKDDSA